VVACLPYGGHELIPTPREGFDEGRAVGSIAQGLPDFQDVLLHDFRIDVSVWPDRFQDFLLCYEPIGVLDEVAQHIECLRRQRHTLFAAPRTVADRIEPERVELLHRSITRAPSASC